MPFITSVAGSGQSSYFADESGHPIMLKGDTVWAFPANAGAYTNTYQQDYDQYTSARSGHGFNAVLIAALPSAQNDGNNGTQTWDGVSPFSSPGVLNNTYWTRIDYLVTSAANAGITILMDPLYSGDTSSGDAGASGACNGFSSTNFTDYGTALGNRYKTASNIVWWYGGDYFDGQQAGRMNPLKNAISATGDTHLVSVENNSECTSRKQSDDNATLTWGSTNANFSIVYSYNTGYWVVEYAYNEASPICVVRGDGHYDNNGQASFMRNLIWWVLSSGSRGYNHGSEGVWGWPSGGMNSVNNEAFPKNVAKAAFAAVSALTNWHQLIPDTSSVLVTAGRGTRASGLASGGGGGQYASGNTYVTASRTADKTLALIYIPSATTITIDQAQIASNYTATWIDPASGATSAGTPGSTFNSSTKGNNSAGSTDWALALQAPSGTAVAPPRLAVNRTEVTGGRSGTPNRAIRVG